MAGFSVSGFRREAPRKLVHAAWLLLPVVFFQLERWWGRGVVLALFAAGVFASCIGDAVRIRFGVFPPKLRKIFRDKEMHSVSGLTMGLVGLLIVFAVFPFVVGVMAVVVLVFGDGVAGLLRSAFRVGGERVLWLFLVEAVVNALALMALFLFVPQAWVGSVSFWVVVAVAFSASFAENVLVGVDDNLTVPLAAGLAGGLLLFLLG